MSSRRDQVDAQRFMMTRVTGALVRAEPEASESPTRRDRTAVIGGALLAVLLLGIVAVWAMIPGSGSTRWQQARMLIVDSTTGARYILIGGQLRPVVDVATATLLAGGRLTPVTVASAQLASVPRGAPVGVAAGPQVLPNPAQVNRGVWRACDLSGVAIVLDLEMAPSPRPLGGNEALPVSAEGRTWLLWGGHRWSLARTWVADVLGLGLMTPVPVAADWLALVPDAGTADPPAVTGTGDPGRRVAGHATTIGDLFRVDLGNGTIGHYLMTGDGLAPLTDTEYLLDRARPDTAGEVTITTAELAAAGQRSPVRPLTTLPPTPPRLPSIVDGSAVCVEYAGQLDEVPRIVQGAPVVGTAVGTGVTVWVSPGTGALLVARTFDPSDASRQVALLVDDRGTGYPIRATDLGTLGYTVARAVVMPPALVDLLPVGPALVRPGGG